MSNATEEELKDLNLKVIFAGLEYSKENLKNAMAFLTLYIEKYELQNTNHIFNAFLAFLYKEKMNQPSVQQNKASLQACELLFNKYLEYAKLLKMKEIPKEELKPKPEPEPIEEENDKKKDDKKKIKMLLLLILKKKLNYKLKEMLMVIQEFIVIINLLF